MTIESTCLEAIKLDGERTQGLVYCELGKKYPECKDGFGRIRLPHFSGRTRSIVVPLPDAKYFSHASNHAAQLARACLVMRSKFVDLKNGEEFYMLNGETMHEIEKTIAAVDALFEEGK